MLTSENFTKVVYTIPRAQISTLYMVGYLKIFYCAHKYFYIRVCLYHDSNIYECYTEGRFLSPYLIIPRLLFAAPATVCHEEYEFSISLPTNQPASKLREKAAKTYCQLKTIFRFVGYDKKITSQQQ